VTIRQGKKGGKKKEEKKRDRRDLDYYLRFFLVFLRASKILILKKII